MHVYILKHASEPRFKIGKANDPQARSNRISRENELDFGRISAFDFGDETLAFQVERSLHSLFSPWRLAPDDSWGGGRTEWFDLSALSAAHSTLTSMEGLARSLGQAGAAKAPPSFRKATKQKGDLSRGKPLSKTVIAWTAKTQPETTAGVWTPKREIYSHYQKWAFGNDRKPVSSHVFWGELAAFFSPRGGEEFIECRKRLAINKNPVFCVNVRLAFGEDLEGNAHPADFLGRELPRDDRKKAKKPIRAGNPFASICNPPSEKECLNWFLDQILLHPRGGEASIRELIYEATAEDKPPHEDGRRVAQDCLARNGIGLKQPAGGEPLKILIYTDKARAMEGIFGTSPWYLEGISNWAKKAAGNIYIAPISDEPWAV